MARIWTSADVALLRLFAQGLLSPHRATSKDVVGVVRRLGAVQAQDFGAAKWALGVRALGAVEATVLEALDSGHVVRSWPMRGTLHFVLAEDLGWFLDLSTEALIQGAHLRRKALDLDLPQIEKARKIAVKALSGKTTALSREALLEAIDHGGVSTAQQRGYHLLWHLSQTGTLVLGPTDGEDQLFVLSEAWIQKPRKLDRDEALGELAARYFDGHGPASQKDLMRWAKLTAKAAKRGLEVAGKKVAALEADGLRLFHGPALLDDWASRKKEAQAAVFALPGFDELLIGYENKAHTLEPEYLQQVVPGSNGVFRPLIVEKGRVTGTWTRKATSKGVTVTSLPFEKPSASARKRFEEALAAYAHFLGRPVSLA